MDISKRNGFVHLIHLEETAKKAAFSAGELIVKNSHRALKVELKNTISPFVTELDRKVELEIRKIIQAAYPDHSIQGEEFPDDIPKPEINSKEKVYLEDSQLETHLLIPSDRVVWVIDPIDGTTAFLAGMPSFTILIGIWVESIPILGIIYQPLTKQIWVGGLKRPTTLNDSLCSQSAGNNVHILASSNPECFGKKARDCFKKEAQKSDHTLYGGDGFLFGLLAEGRISCVIEDGLAWHDIAACIPIVLGAGGKITDLDGNRLKPGKAFYGVIARKKE